MKECMIAISRCFIGLAAMIFGASGVIVGCILKPEHLIPIGIMYGTVFTFGILLVSASTGKLISAAEHLK